MMRKIIISFVQIFLSLLLVLSTLFFRDSYADNGASVNVAFLLLAPAAKKVEVIGDFNAWKPDSALLQGPDAAGNWRTTVAIPDDVRAIRYIYLVDGKTVILDPAYPVVSDDFGGKNNLRIMP